jgi:hypothetical protein
MNDKSQNPAKKVAFLFSILGFLAFAVNPVMALRDMNFNGSVRQIPVGNDEFATAYEVIMEYRPAPVSPFEATENLTDPPSTPCNLARGLATVWYKYTPAVKELVHMDSIGSSYDTFMVLYTYDGATLTEVACNDDAGVTTFGSAINYTLAAGTTYYIQVAQFNGTLTDVPMDQLKPVPGVGELRGADAVHVFRLVPLLTKSFRSVGGYDGYVVESNENSGVGLLKDSTLPYVRVGDDEKKRQFRSILAFNTETLDDTAMITTALVKVKKNYVTTGNIFTQLGMLKMDIRMPYFGQQLNLESNDFSAVSSKDLAVAFATTPTLGWYRANVSPASFSFFNRTGYTQFRLRFTKDDNNDTIPNYFRFYSGNATAANRPILIIRYYIP